MKGNVCGQINELKFLNFFPFYIDEVVLSRINASGSEGGVCILSRKWPKKVLF